MEDTTRIERDWADYLERFVLSENTAGVDVTGLQPFLKRSVLLPASSYQSKEDIDFRFLFYHRNLRKAAPQGTSIYPSYLTVKSALQSKICMRSYRIFFVAGTEDLISRATPLDDSADLSDATLRKTAMEEEKKSTFEKWIQGRKLKLEEYAQKSLAGMTSELEKPVVVAGTVAADVEPTDGSKAKETKIVASVQVAEPVVAVAAVAPAV